MMRLNAHFLRSLPNGTTSIRDIRVLEPVRSDLATTEQKASFVWKSRGNKSKSNGFWAMFKSINIVSHGDPIY